MSNFHIQQYPHFLGVNHPLQNFPKENIIELIYDLIDQAVLVQCFENLVFFGRLDVVQDMLEKKILKNPPLENAIRISILGHQMAVLKYLISLDDVKGVRNEKYASACVESKNIEAFDILVKAGLKPAIYIHLLERSDDEMCEKLLPYFPKRQLDKLLNTENNNFYHLRKRLKIFIPKLNLKHKMNDLFKGTNG